MAMGLSSNHRLTIWVGGAKNRPRDHWLVKSGRLIQRQSERVRIRESVRRQVQQSRWVAQ